MKTLVLAEKPSVGRDIGRVLHCTPQGNGFLEGKDYIVTWGLGHLVTLKDPEGYDKKYKEWKMEELPIVPKKLETEVIRQTAKQFQTVKKQVQRQDVKEIVIATDAGREGELVARWILKEARNQKPCRRLWVSSVTDKAIRDGFAHLKNSKEYDPLYRAAVSRAEADWLVGINATRALTCKYNAQLSCGRVQTPTLAMIQARENEIHQFVPESYYTITAKADGITFTWREGKTGSLRTYQKERAEEIKKKCETHSRIIKKTEKKEKKVYPPLLYDLTELQRDANKRFGFSAKETLNIMQRLYENHKVLTYPRTDSRYLTSDVVGTLSERLDACAVGPYRKMALTVKAQHPETKKWSFVDNKKVSDHHAIIPTMELAKADLDKIPGGEMQILSLIAQRLICATGEKHIYETVKAELSCNGIMFTATGKSILQNGWKTYEEQFKKSLKSGNSKAEKEETPLPQLSEGMTFEQVETKVSEHFTAPPKHFTEDTLLSAMEHAGSEQMNDEVERKGLGTPATRAAIIEKLVEKGFVERKNKQMFPTDDGIKLITVLPEVVKSPKLTAEWENDLTLIAKGEKSADTFLAGIEELVSDLVHTYHEVEENGKHMFGSDREVIGKCPKCGGNVYESKSNFYCENRACDFALFKNNKYFASMRKELNKSIAQALLNKGEAKVSGLYSQKKDSTFSAVIHMDASGKYPQFSMTFDNKKQKSNQK